MQENAQKFNLSVVATLTSLAFVIGGLFKTWLGCLISLENFLLIFLAIWSGFLVQSAIGMAVLAFWVRRHYSFRKLWLAGISAFALGILFPALLMNQFFYALLILPGFLVGLFFRLILNEQSLLFVITLGQMIVIIVQNNMPWFSWLYEHFGLSLTNFMHIVIDAVIGFFVALGVGLMLRKRNQKSSVL